MVEVQSGAGVDHLGIAGPGEPPLVNQHAEVGVRQAFRRRAACVALVDQVVQLTWGNYGYPREAGNTSVLF